MLAYNNDPDVKTAVLAQLARHRAADEIVKGQYWERGKGCAVGCTIYSGRHVEYEERFGIPEVLARLEDRIFEGLPNAIARRWPERFMEAIAPGRDLAMVWPRLALWLLTEEVSHHAQGDLKTSDAVAGVGALYREWCDTDIKPDAIRWIASKDIVRTVIYTTNAAGYAASAAGYAASAAAYAANVAYAAANAANVAYAAYAAANAAANAANVANVASARKAYYARIADKLVELLESA